MIKRPATYIVRKLRTALLTQKEGNFSLIKTLQGTCCRDYRQDKRNFTELLSLQQFLVITFLDYSRKFCEILSGQKCSFLSLFKHGEHPFCR